MFLVRTEGGKKDLVVAGVLFMPYKTTFFNPVLMSF